MPKSAGLALPGSDRPFFRYRGRPDVRRQLAENKMISAWKIAQKQPLCQSSRRADHHKGYHSCESGYSPSRECWHLCLPDAERRHFNKLCSGPERVQQVPPCWTPTLRPARSSGRWATSPIASNTQITADLTLTILPLRSDHIIAVRAFCPGGFFALTARRTCGPRPRRDILCSKRS